MATRRNESRAIINFESRVAHFFDLSKLFSLLEFILTRIHFSNSAPARFSEQPEGSSSSHLNLVSFLAFGSTRHGGEQLGSSQQRARVGIGGGREVEERLADAHKALDHLLLAGAEWQARTQGPGT